MLAVGLAVSLALFGDLSLFAGLATQLDVAGLTLAQLGVLLSVHRVIRIIANPLVGVWMDRFGRRPLFLLGAVLGVVSTALYGLGYGFWLFLAARLMWGMAWALLNVGGLTITLDLSTPATRGRLSGMYNTWVWVGYGAGPLIGGLLIDLTGFRSAMLLCAAISALGFAAAARLLQETHAPARRAGVPRRAPALRLAAFARGALDALRAQPLLRRVIALNGLMTFAGDGILLATVAVLMEQRLDSSLGIGVATASGAMIALRSLLAALTSPLAGRISDGPAGRKAVVAFSLGCGMLAFLVLAGLPSLPGAILGAVLIALSAGAGLSVLAAWMGDIVARQNQAAALGAYAAVGDIGSSSGPYLALNLLPLVGLPWVFALTALVLASGFLLLPRNLAELQPNHHETVTKF
jgi:MFS family permease